MTVARWLVVLAACAPPEEAAPGGVDTVPVATDTAAWVAPPEDCLGLCLAWKEAPVLGTAPDGRRPDLAAPTCNAVGVDLGVCPSPLRCGPPRASWDAQGRGVVAPACEGRTDYVPVFLERSVRPDPGELPHVEVEVALTVGGEAVPALAPGAVARLLLHGRGAEGEHVVALPTDGTGRAWVDLPVGDFAVDAVVLGDKALGPEDWPVRYAVAARGLLEVRVGGSLSLDLPAGRVRADGISPVDPGLQLVAWTARGGWIALPAAKGAWVVDLWLAPDEVELEARIPRASSSFALKEGTWHFPPFSLYDRGVEEVAVAMAVVTLPGIAFDVPGLQVVGARLAPVNGDAVVEIRSAFPPSVPDVPYDAGLLLQGTSPTGSTRGLAVLARGARPEELASAVMPPLRELSVDVAVGDLGPDLSLVLVGEDGSWQSFPVPEDGHVASDAVWVARGEAWLAGGQLRSAVQVAADVMPGSLDRVIPEVPTVTLEVVAPEGVDLTDLSLQRVSATLTPRPWRRWDGVVPRIPVDADGLTPLRLPVGAYRLLSGTDVLPGVIWITGDGPRVVELPTARTTVELLVPDGLPPKVPPGQSRGELFTPWGAVPLEPTGRARATFDVVAGVPFDVRWRCPPDALCPRPVVAPVVTGLRLLDPDSAAGGVLP
ncbi:MAG: hypothetical protein H6732_20130 [Alphaproteobacteria bacterium]|nr:hypothetical protein [Alphaproteobacteria bacterium]